MIDRLADRVLHRRRCLRAGGGELGVGHAQVAGGDAAAVEALEGPADRGVAVLAHIGDERGDRGLERGVEDVVESAGQKRGASGDIQISPTADEQRRTHAGKGKGSAPPPKQLSAASR